MTQNLVYLFLSVLLLAVQPSTSSAEPPPALGIQAGNVLSASWPIAGTAGNVRTTLEASASSDKDDKERDKNKRYKEDDNGDDPRDTPPPVIYGEDIDADCPIDVDIHLPAAQDPAQPLVAEGQDATEGAWTLRNDDMDATTAQIIASRLQNPTNLDTAEGKPDLAVNGAIAAENDLVAVDVHNSTGLANVYLNVYAMAAQQGRTRVRTHTNRQRANQIANRLTVWRNANRTGGVALPLAVPGPRDRVWIEGLGAGRYRFVLFYIPNGTPAQARGVRATEVGGPHGQTTPGTVTVEPPAGVQIGCYRHVRLTVAVTDVFQQSRRKHLYDVLWGGRPVFDGHAWPGGGTFRWQQSGGFNGTWLRGQVHGVRVDRGGPVAGGNTRIREVHGAFQPNVQAVGQRIQGSQRYQHRVQLRYQVEGVTLVRDEPVTLMVPDHVSLRPGPLLGQGFAQPHWGATYSFTLQAHYVLFDQHDRTLVGAGGANAYKRQYGTRLQIFEALGMGTQAREVNDRVQWRYRSPINPQRNFDINIDTKQRSNAIPLNGSLSNAQFNDSFTLQISNQQRGMLQQDIRQNNTLASRPVFAVSQDIVVLLRNGVVEYDVRVARGQRLEILAPEQRSNPAAQWGGMGFQMTLGDANGTQLDTGNPDRLGPNHNPPAP